MEIYIKTAKKKRNVYSFRFLLFSYSSAVFVVFFVVFRHCFFYRPPQTKQGKQYETCVINPKARRARYHDVAAGNKQTQADAGVNKGKQQADIY